MHRIIVFALATLIAFGQKPPVRTGMQNATAALQKGDFAGAEQQLRAELKLRPMDAEAVSLLAVALDNQKRLRDADDAHRQAITLAPRSAKVMSRYGNHLAFAGDDAGAKQAFTRALALDPADRAANMAMAGMELRARDAAGARRALEYLDHVPASPDADLAVLRITALELAGRGKEAETAFNRLSTAIAKDAAANASSGWMLAQAGQHARAETLLSRAVALQPGNFQVVYDLGVVALYAQHYQRAREVLETAVKLQPQSADALYSLAFASSSLKKHEDALSALAQAAKLDPKRADIQRLIAVTTGELEAHEDSAAAWERYYALAPNDDTARRELGFSRIHLRQFDTGLADLEWYASRHPDDPVGHYELGIAYSMNDPTKGMDDLDRALKLKPDFVAARAARGALNYVQGKPEEAAKDLEIAAKADPDNGLVLDRLGQAYRAVDRLADSVKALRRAVALAPDESTIQLHLASALAEAGETAESEALMGKYRQMRPPQAPRDLMRYLSLSPEQQRADYRARVEKAIRDNPGDVTAQVRLMELALEEGQLAQAKSAAEAIKTAKAPPSVLAEAGRALLEARQYEAARDLLAGAGPSVDLAVALFHTAGPEAGLRQLDTVSEKNRDAGFHFAKAQMLSAAGKNDEALLAAEQALRQAPARTDLHWQRAVLLNKLQRTAEAIQLLDQAAKNTPQDYRLPLIKAAILHASGKTAEAQKLLETIRHQWPEAVGAWVANGLILADRGQRAEARTSLETAAALGARSAEVYYALAESGSADAEAALKRARILEPEAPKKPVASRLFLSKPPQDW